MKKRKYTVTDKVKQRHLAMADWDKRIRLLTLIAQGHNIHSASKELKVSHQAARDMWNKIKDLTVEQAQQIVADLEDRMIK